MVSAAVSKAAMSGSLRVVIAAASSSVSSSPNEAFAAAFCSRASNSLDDEDCDPFEQAGADDSDVELVGIVPPIAVDGSDEEMATGTNGAKLHTRREAAALLRQNATKRLAVQRANAATTAAVWNTSVAGFRREEADSSCRIRTPREWQLEGAHPTHTLYNTGTEAMPLIFCSKCTGYVSTGFSSKLEAECKNVGKASHLRLLQWGVSPSDPRARLPPGAQQPRWKRQRR